MFLHYMYIYVTWGGSDLLDTVGQLIFKDKNSQGFREYALFMCGWTLGNLSLCIDFVVLFLFLHPCKLKNKFDPSTSVSFLLIDTKLGAAIYLLMFYTPTDFHCQNF